MNEPNENNPKALFDKLDKCEDNLQTVVKDFEGMLKSANELYDKPEDKKPLADSVKKLAESLRNFKGLAMQLASEMPNDEPIQPHDTDFDSYLLANSKIFIMNKIRDIKVISEKKFA
jgi:uncharacterized protein YoxC